MCVCIKSQLLDCMQPHPDHRIYMTMANAVCEQSICTKTYQAATYTAD